MLTAYDRPTALALDACGSTSCSWATASAVELGFDTTRAVTLAMMTHHVRAVRNGLSGRTSRRHARRDVPHAGGGGRHRPRPRRGRRGLGEAEGALIRRSQRSSRRDPGDGARGPPPTDGRRSPARDEPEDADRIAADARALDAAGCYAVVIEPPAELAARITSVLCPTIGIAAGPECDGQVLVSTDHRQVPNPPRFVKPKANVYAAVVQAGREFADEVRGAGGGEGIARRARCAMDPERAFATARRSPQTRSPTDQGRGGTGAIRLRSTTGPPYSPVQDRPSSTPCSRATSRRGRPEAVASFTIAVALS